MPKYLVRASYTAEGARGVMSDGGSGRRDAIAKTVEGLDGRIESIYFALGEDDVIVVFDLPDNASVAAVGMAVSASGLVKTRTTALLTVEEMDEAARKSVSFRGPGQ